MPLRYKARLIRHLSHAGYQPSDLETLASDLGVEKDEFSEFKGALEQMASDGDIALGQVVTLPPIGDVIVGSFRRNPRGFGFIIPEQKNQEGDLFVPAGQTLDAMTGDTVKARVRYRKRRAGDDRSPYTGEIVEITDRKHTDFSGELRKQGNQWLVYPDGKVMSDPIVIRDADSKNAREGMKVVVQLLHFPEDDLLAEGVITKVLGEAGEPAVETQAVIEAHYLPGEFPDGVMREAVDINSYFEQEMDKAIDEGKGFDPAERLDMRDTFICTIDPPDAKDYDDAISIERIDELPGGGSGWRLGVHIADVSAFVVPGSEIDTEAADRGNSVYLPRLVIPMLPEVLSNGICSLQEGVPRYCKTAFIEYDDGGNVRGEGYAATVIQSAKRMTYLEAQALIDGRVDEAKKHSKTEIKPELVSDLCHAMRNMHTLARAIERRRKKQGMIHLDLPEVELVYNEEGRVTDAVPEDDAYTHKLIEMFMVEANEAVARLFEDLRVPVMRRVHPEPVPGSMDTLRDVVKVAGYRIPKSPTRKEIQGLLDATAGTPAAPAVHMAVLRTLTRAEYSPALIGHFALASKAYSHFTSPIRRYPDLTTHRALNEYLAVTSNGRKRPKSDADKIKIGKKIRETDEYLDEQTLVRIGNHCNMTEERAENAERELRQFLVLQLLEEHIGETFPGIVTGVTQRGVFVQLEKYLCEGLVSTSDLPTPNMGKGRFERAHWRIDSKSGALVEVNSGRSYSMGDRVKVIITEIDLARRQMELTIADGESREVGKSKNLADRLTLGEGVGGGLDSRTGSQRRAQKSRSRDKRKSDFRADRKGKGKRQ